MTEVRTASPVAESRLIAILRGGDGRHLEAVAATLVDAGLCCLEITTNTPGFEQTLVALRGRYGTEVHLGVGTVRTIEHVAVATRLGADFIVAPTILPDVGQAAKESELDWYPGAMTPTEVDTAWQAGATPVKLFPAAQAGGPDFVRALRAPLDDVPIIPTGGVGLDNIGDYLQAGALAVGVGSPLIGDSLHTGDLDDVSSRAKQFKMAVAGVGR